MKNIQHLFKTMFLSLTLLCLSHSVEAQCVACNQYLMTVETLNFNSGFSLSANASTVYKRIDFKFQNGSIGVSNLLYPILVDFQNTQQYILVNEFDAVTQNYGSFGNHVINVKDNNGLGEQASLSINIRSLSNVEYKAPDEVWDISNNYTPTCVGCLPDVNGGLAKAYIKYANSDKKMRKALVFVEGIDFGRDSITDPQNGSKAITYGDFGWNVFYLGHKVDDSWDFVKKMPEAREAIQSKGYDIILLDFRNGADYMQANGEILIKLLKRIKQVRVADNQGIVHPISVLGASMGGQVAKYALARMEKESPDDFCTNNYMSFDSPHKGANIPISLQSMLYFLEKAGKAPNRFTNTMLRPAAKQLLQHHIANTTQLEFGKFSNNIPSSFSPLALTGSFNHQSAWYNELASFGTYPRKSRKVAISCGSEVATPLAWRGNSNHKMFGMRVGTTVTGVPIPVASLHLFSTKTSNSNISLGAVTFLDAVNSQLVIQPYSNGDNVIFTGAFPDKLLAGKASITYHQLTVRTKPNVNLADWDSAPGCLRSDLFDVGKQFRGEFPLGTDPILTISTNVDSTTFMPTMSCLDINWPLNDVSFDKNIKKADILVNKLTPFEDYYAPETNFQHVEITTPMIDKLKQWLGENERDIVTLPNSNGSTYNYGFAKRWIPSMSVNESGTLRINNKGATSYGSGVAANENDYETYLFDCGGTLLNINSGGKMILGSDTDLKKGLVAVSKSSILNINVGAQLLLQKGSKITIENGGKMNINGGTTTIKDGSQIIVEKGGQLIIKAGANISLNDLAQIIVEKGGKLILEKGVGSQLAFNATVNGHILVKGKLEVNTPIKMNGTAYFDFASKNEVTLLSTFDITGNGKAVKMINLQNSTTLSLQNQAIVVRNGTIAYQDFSKIELPAGKIADVVDVRFIATSKSGVGTTALTNIGGVSPKILRVQKCEFNDLSKCIDLQHDEEQTQNSPVVFNVTESSFSNYRIFGVLLSNANNLQAHSSSFSSNVIATITSKNACESCVLSIESKRPPAIIAISIPSGIVGLTDCEIEGVGGKDFKNLYIKDIKNS
jgi:hypothetical protein